MENISISGAIFISFMKPFASKCSFPSRIRVSSSLGDGGEVPPPPSDQFRPLQAVFRRRLLAGAGAASLIALGANFCGGTSFLLGFSPEVARSLKLDAVYPVGGFFRYIDTSQGFEFVYPESWVGDQTLLYRAAGEAERPLDPPPVEGRKKMKGPVVAFGPPASTGELNVSVIVSSVPIGFSMESFGGAGEVGDAIVKTITASSRGTDVKGRLLAARLREDASRNIKYYELEFVVQSSTFQRHNVAVCCAHKGKLFTLNAQAPESVWPHVKSQFTAIAHSFNIEDMHV